MYKIGWLLALTLSASPCWAAEKKPEAIHAQPWAFGQSTDREAEIWRKGVSGAAIHKGARPYAQENRGQTAQPGKGQTGKNAGRSKGSLDFSWKDEEGSWKVAPEQKRMQPDEERVRDRRHVLGAYAGVETGDDFKFSLGPELILKDDQHGDEGAKSDQPDTALGLGMKFQYDF